MILTGGLAALTVVGALQALAGCAVTASFTRSITREPDVLPPITILKPLYGQEPFLAEALTTLCEQDYPAPIQIVCGVGAESDDAVPVVRALQSRYPDVVIALVIDPAQHGVNPKVGNLINMLPAARHDILVIADSDVHARGDYLRHLVEALQRDGVGLVTTLYSGLPAFRTMAGLLGATQITHGFLPGAVLARALGRRDCLGATMCLRRDTLERIGGFAALKDHLADDSVLGRRVRALGLDVALAHTIVATTVAESDLAALWRHELRWARTIRTLEPAGFAASVLQYPLFFAILTVIASAGAAWSWALFVAVWAVRACAATAIDRALSGMLGGLAFRGPLWLLPLRDLLSAAEWVASHAGRRVDWRGEILQADTPPRLSPSGLAKGPNAR
jgi:ceramide glucosyltransferase